MWKLTCDSIELFSAISSTLRKGFKRSEAVGIKQRLTCPSTTGAQSSSGLCLWAGSMNQQGAGSANRDAVQQRPKRQQLYETMRIRIRNDVHVWKTRGLRTLPSTVPNQIPSGSGTRHQITLSQTRNLRWRSRGAQVRYQHELVV